jgi:hypothetical protein
MPPGFFDTLNPYDLVGLNPGSAAMNSVLPSAAPGVARSAGPGMADHEAKPWSPDSAFFWFAVIAAAAVGFIGTSTSVRVGPIKASGSIGDPA